MKKDYTITLTPKMKKPTQKDVLIIKKILAEGTDKNNYKFIFEDVDINCDHNKKQITVATHRDNMEEKYQEGYKAGMADCESMHAYIPEAVEDYHKFNKRGTRYPVTELIIVGLIVGIIFGFIFVSYNNAQADKIVAKIEMQ